MIYSYLMISFFMICNLLTCCNFSADKSSSSLQSCDTLFYSKGQVKRVVKCVNGVKTGWEYNYKNDGDLISADYYNNGSVQDRIDFSGKKVASVVIDEGDTILDETQAFNRYYYFKKDKVISFLIDYNKKSDPEKLTGSSIRSISLRSFKKVEDHYLISIILEFAEPPFLDFDFGFDVYSEHCTASMEVLREDDFDRTVRIFDIAIKGCKGKHTINVEHLIKSSDGEVIYTDSDKLSFTM